MTAWSAPTRKDGGRGRSRIPVALEGLPFVLVAVAALVWGLVWAGAGGWGAKLAVPAVAAAGAAFMAYFFRDPDRRIPEEADVVVSPADGKVTSVDPSAHADFVGGPATRITIFLSIFDVHVQRAPAAGRVESYEYEGGRHMAAWRKEAGSLNERASLGISTESGPIVVRQVAGLAARRIVTYPREGARLAKGDRIGLIRFGSRVDLFVPPNWPVCVRRGDRAKAGETPVARIPPTAEKQPGDGTAPKVLPQPSTQKPATRRRRQDPRPSSTETAS